MTHLQRFGLIALISVIFAGTGIRAQAPAEALPGLWSYVRVMLTGLDSDAFFRELKDAEIPPQEQMFVRNVVSRPSAKTLIVSVEDPAGDATLVFDNVLKEIEPGTRLYFVGIVQSFVKKPYMLTLSVEDFLVSPKADPTAR